ncbi:NAD+ diphosphatase [Pedococcus dokdonensis]|uniref:NAD(+) diphosphatase n=1 Tax=Pedococcus dokdonensis TaxID=443156 RepID=A0A1H0L0C1_9MICO|nr:NAD(+) diphosphatase [Pedococcus dokdonensis]SDO61421.1 NAD+ diphosphatase [Pedococcus dokdonensis]
MGLLIETLPHLALARPGLDRHAERRAEPHLLDRLLADPRTRVLEVHGDRVPVRWTDAPDQAAAADGGSGGLPALDLRAPAAGDAESLVLYLGQDGDGTAYLAVARPAADGGDDAQAADGDARLCGLRQVGADLSDRDATIFATALALANWHGTHGHCPRCGAPTQPVQAGWLRRCDRDGSEHYPRTDVAVIMSVVDADDRLLLARGAGWGAGRFSVLAGFLEPGESLAAAVAREVHEEVGLQVHDVEYLGDQPWPFPNSLMVGFTARAQGSELRLQEAEIAEARWFSRDEYREIVAQGRVSPSTRLSISRRLIERWLGQDLDEVTPD